MLVKGARSITVAHDLTLLQLSPDGAQDKDSTAASDSDSQGGRRVESASFDNETKDFVDDEDSD